MAKELTLKIDTEWLLAMAEKEDGGIISVGGLVSDIQRKEQQEAAAQPVELPPVGSVWGVPDKPETRRFVVEVRRICGIDQITFTRATITHMPWTKAEDWHSWVRESGAVDLLADAEREATALNKLSRG